MNEKIECPFCGEMIMRTAKKCRFCGEWIDASAQQPVTNPQITTTENNSAPSMQSVTQTTITPPAHLTSPANQKPSNQDTGTSPVYKNGKLVVDKMKEFLEKKFPIKNYGIVVFIAAACVIVADIFCLIGDYELASYSKGLLIGYTCFLGCDAALLYVLMRNFNELGKRWNGLIIPLIVIKAVRLVSIIDIWPSIILGGFCVLLDGILSLILVCMIKSNYEGRLKNVANWTLALSICNILSGLGMSFLSVLALSFKDWWTTFIQETMLYFRTVNGYIGYDLWMCVFYIVIYIKTSKMFKTSNK